MQDLQLSSTASTDEAPPTLPEFIEKHTLTGHTKPVNTLAISPDQAFILSGGDDCILIIWDVLSGRLLQEIRVHINGPVGSATWVWTDEDRVSSGFIFGCADGTVQYFRKEAASFRPICTQETSASRASVDAIAFDSHHHRVSTASGGTTCLWSLDHTGMLYRREDNPLLALNLALGLKEIRQVETQDLIVSTLLFIEAGTILVVCYLESQEAVAYEIDPWKVLWRRILRTRIGFALAAPNKTLAVSNLSDGIDIYSTPPSRLLDTHQHPVRQNYRLQMASFYGGAFVAVGSDSGKPRIYSRTGGLHRTVPHGHRLVPTIVSSQSGDTCYLGTAATEHPFDIKVWVATKAEVMVSSVEDGNQVLSPKQLLLIAFLCILTQIILSQLEPVSELGYMVAGRLLRLMQSY
ncbi:WD40 repeat-like protein [Coprinellus micaceus]|uniref:WD40 repeat-like protein n=1 Tax=Coprinellus micaceus TaxID=71717 RepID=A0A4Y7TZ09_COPMI|nr:WD40 repeat-like protein [Coprinellus micaceus]